MLDGQVKMCTRLVTCTSMHAEFETEDCFIAIGSETIERFACDALCSEIFQLF